MADNSECSLSNGKGYMRIKDTQHDGNKQYDINEDDGSPSLRLTIVACIVSITSMCILSLGVVGIEILDGSIPIFEINTFRFITQAILMLPIQIYNGWDLRIPLIRWPIFGAVVLSFVGFNVFYYAAAMYLAAGTLSGVTNSFTICGNAFLSICIKSERSLQLYIGSVIAIVGSVLMNQPAFLFKNANLPPRPTINWTSPCSVTVLYDEPHFTGDLNFTQTVFLGYAITTDEMNRTVFTNNGTTSEMNETNRASMWIGALLVALAGTVDAFWYQTMGKCVQHVSSTKVAFWSAALGSVVSVTMMGIFETPQLPSGLVCWVLVGAYCIGLSQLGILLPWCLKYLSPSVSAMLNSVYQVILLVLQYTALKNIKPGHHNWLEILGAIFCLLGVIIGPIWHILKQAQQNSLKCQQRHNIPTEQLATKNTETIDLVAKERQR